MSEHKYIYTLSDPATGQVKYIGASQDPVYRLRQHRIPSFLKRNKTPKSIWIKELRDAGLSPLMDIVDKVEFNEWEFWEQYYYHLFRSWGFSLLNLTNGGLGMSGYKFPESTKVKMRSKTHTEEARRSISEKMKNREIKDSTREKLRKTSSGRKMSPEAIEKMRQTKIGKPSSNKGKKATRINGKLKYL